MLANQNEMVYQTAQKVEYLHLRMKHNYLIPNNGGSISVELPLISRISDV